MTGGNLPLPAGPDFRGTYLFPGSNGYDGQSYRVIAHDPGLRRGLWIDSPRLRYRRILLPALAYAFALGAPGRVDGAYIAVQLGFLFLGVYWAARWAALHGRSPAWGLCFLALPATLVSLDRMTPDLPLAALCCAWALYRSGADIPVCGVGARDGIRPLVFLALAPFARETGLLLVAAAALAEAGARRFRRALWTLAAAVPYAVWCIYAWMRTPPDATNLFARLPFSGIAAALFHGLPEPRGAFRPALIALDYAALAGMVLAMVLAAWLWLRNRRDPIAIAALLFALLAVQATHPEIWAHVFSFGRVFSPLLLLLALSAARKAARHRALLLAPVILMLPRVAAQFAPQAFGVLRGLLG